jgi:hypothetical protein
VITAASAAWKWILFFAIFFALYARPAAAQNYPNSFGYCFGTAACAFNTTGGFTPPGPGGVMLVIATCNSVGVTQIVTDAPYGSSWTQVAAGYQGTTGTTSAWWAKNGVNSGPDTVTATCSSGGSYRTLVLWYSSGVVNASAANPVDTSVYSPNGSVACGSTLSVTYTLLTSNGPLVADLVYNRSNYSPGVSSSSGPQLNDISQTLGDGEIQSNVAGWNPFTGAGTLIGVASGTHTTGWSWGVCNAAGGIPYVYFVALKAAAGKTGRHQVQWVNYRDWWPDAPYQPFHPDPLIFARALLHKHPFGEFQERI